MAEKKNTDELGAPFFEGTQEMLKALDGIEAEIKKAEIGIQMQEELGQDTMSQRIRVDTLKKQVAVIRKYTGKLNK